MNFDVCLIFNNQTLAPLILFINWTSALTPRSSHTTHSLKGFSSQILASFYSGFEVNIITQTIILGCLSEIRKHHETLFCPNTQPHLTKILHTRLHVLQIKILD